MSRLRELLLLIIYPFVLSGNNPVTAGPVSVNNHLSTADLFMYQSPVNKYMSTAVTVLLSAARVYVIKHLLTLITIACLQP